MKSIITALFACMGLFATPIAIYLLANPIVVVQEKVVVQTATSYKAVPIVETRYVHVPVPKYSVNLGAPTIVSECLGDKVKAVTVDWVIEPIGQGAKATVDTLDYYYSDSVVDQAVSASANWVRSWF